MAMQLIDICSRFAQTLLPQQCLLCGAPAGTRSLCNDCRADLPWHPEEACPVCALPTTSAAVCGACLKSPPAFAATTAALSYQFPVNAMLQAYKYGDRLALAPLFGQLLADRVAATPMPDIVTCMPLHADRLRERGFNQAAELARVVAKRLHLPLALDACAKVRATTPQTGLPLAERGKNLRGAFASTGNIAGKRISVVDDVMTSGASLNELARTLRKAGAAEVNCWVVARTLPG